MNDIAISLTNVTKTFTKNNFFSNKFSSKKISSMNQNKKLIALDNVSFDILKGKTIGIIGLNGSGKTTLLRTIAGIYTPDSGSVKTEGYMAPLLQLGTGFHNDLIPKDNIVIYGMLLGMPKSEISEKVDNIIEFAELNEFTNMKLKHFSSGMRARLAFSTDIQINPDILLVDEILSVGDLAFREKSFKAFLSFKKKEKTILLFAHN